MRLFSKNKPSVFKGDIYEDVPVPKDGELLAIPIDNQMWHPSIAVYQNNRKSPDWYKNILSGDFGLRGCYGLGDYMRMGYTIPLWANLEVRPPISKLNPQWSARYTAADQSLEVFKTAKLEFLDKHHVFKQSVVEGQLFGNSQTGECPIRNVKGLPDSDYLKLTNPWLFRTAPGWSCLFIQPQWEPKNEYDILCGVVNTDMYHHCNVVLNIKTASAFTVEAGTPLLHVIPFKRSQIIKKSQLIRGDESLHRVLDGLGFGMVYRDEQWAGKYNKEQHRIDKELE